MKTSTNFPKGSFSRLLTALIFIASLACTGYRVDSRTFLPFMITTYIIAAVIYTIGWQRTHKEKKQKISSFLFSPDIWLHPSAKSDYTIIIINMMLTLIILPIFILPSSVVVDTIQNLLKLLPLDPSSEKPGMEIIILYTTVSFVVSDFMSYWAHRIMHQFPWLWEFHKVHHSAEIMTPLTLYRAHPLDLCISASFRVLAYSLVSGIFLYIYPNIESLATVAGVSIFWLFFNATTANLRHSHIWISFGPTIEKFMMSPAQHQIHHSTQVKHFDKNFGNDLSLWDYLFKTAYITDSREEITFGLGKNNERMSSLQQIYIKPFIKSFKILKKSFYKVIKKGKKETA